MSPDEVIELRREWTRWSFSRLVPDQTLLASVDWLTYVGVMCDELPGEPSLVFPSEEDVGWAWPQGLCIVFGEPVAIAHTIVSDLGRPVPAHPETQLARGLLIGPTTMMPTQVITAGVRARGEPTAAHPIAWIGDDPSDFVEGHWTPSSTVGNQDGSPISHSARFVFALLTAIGHHATTLEVPAAADRGERRRLQRELPTLRVLALTGDARRSHGTGGPVAWKRRWMVRGHWRLQPYGPGRSLRKARWIDPYVKGPAEAPLDTRTTIWRTP